MVYALSFVTTSFFVGVFLYGTSLASTIDDDIITKRRAQLEAELAKLEDLLDQQQVLLQSKQGERASLERDLDMLNTKIKKSQLAVEAQRVAVADLEQDIFLKEATVLELEEKIDRERDSLSGLIRRTAELDDQTIAEVIFSGKSFSDFFEEIDDFQEVKIALEKSFKELEVLRDENLQVAEKLGERKAEEEELHELQKLQRARLENQEAEKVKVLEVTKGEEGKYQELIESTQKSAAQIRSELFELRGNAAINLGDAIEFATFAGVKTGVRPALILGVLKQETEFGSNVGGCTYNQILYGEPVMKPTRDKPVYLVILQTLGINPNTQMVSCSSAQNWGGAMGPTQFIPTTWACFGGYINTRTGTCGYTSAVEDFYSGPWKYDASQDRLRVVRGKQGPSNPWDNQDAFIATALYLKDLGADAGTAYAERLSALRYYAGSANATNPAYSFYGDNVMDHAAYFQKQIDALKSLSN
jgi:hypothetical protein